MFTNFDLEFLNEPRVKSGKSAGHDGSFYVSGVALDKETRSPHDYYLHPNGRWNRTMEPTDKTYFSSEQAALSVLTEVAKTLRRHHTYEANGDRSRIARDYEAGKFK